MCITNPPLPCRRPDFLTLKPVVERHARIVFRNLFPADREEAVAEAVAAAFQSFVSLTRRGKDPFQFPSVVATRAAQRVWNGRRVGARLAGRDVFSPLAQQSRRFRVHSLAQAAIGDREPLAVVVEPRRGF